MEQLTKDNSYQTLKFINVAIEEIPTVAQQLEVIILIDFRLRSISI